MGFNEYMIGKTNRFGYEISEILYRAEGKYVIYICKDYQGICYDGTEDTLKNISSISKELAKIQMITHGKKDYSFLTAQLQIAISTAADGNIKEAIDILDKLETNIIKIEENSGRIRYICGALLIIIIQTVIIVLFSLINYSTKIRFWNDNNVLFYMALLGSIGGFLSIIRRIKSIEIDSSNGNFLNYFNGILRMFISIICGVVTYFLIKSNIVLGIVNDSKNANSAYLTYVLTIISGFSENFIPNIFNKIELGTTQKMAIDD